MILPLSADFFKIIFSKNSFRNTIRVSNSLDPDQDRRSVGPNLGPNCLQRLSADDKSGRLVSTYLTMNTSCISGWNSDPIQPSVCVVHLPCHL